MNELPINKAVLSVGEPLERLKQAIDRLIHEHAGLKTSLLELYGMSKAIGWDEDVINWVGSLRDLRNKVICFMQVLDTHSCWEESEVFPLIGWYFGAELKQFHELEKDHDLATNHIATFLKRVEQLDAPVRRDEANEITAHLLQAYEVLTHHFQQEEQLIDSVSDKSNAIGF